MTEQEIRIRKIDAKLNDEGEGVLRAILEDGMDVVIGASAGTGKTTLLTNILSEAIIREVETSGQSPLDSIVAVTFTVEAARQMKKKTRKMLTDYNEKHPLPNFDSLVYALETESWITTIDSLTQRIMRMVSLDIGFAPDVGIIDEYDNAQIISEVFDALADKYSKEVESLELATRERTKELLTSALNRSSLYVIDPAKLLRKIKKSFALFYRARLGLGRDKQMVKNHNSMVMKSFSRMLPGFVRGVRERYRVEGGYTYDELRRLVVEFLRSESASGWKQWFGKRFKLLLIDEFQDTSVAQTELLSHLAGSDTKIMIIGDPKQSIYTWRNAEPTILSDIIQAASHKKPDRYFRRRFSYHPITQNFRSVLSLVDMSNYLFSDTVKSSIFEARRFTRGLHLPNPEIEAKAPHPQDKRTAPPHIHRFFTDAKARKRQKYSESEYIAHIIGRLANGNLQIKVRKEVDEKWQWVDPKLGDCAILIPRRGKKWRQLRSLFIERKIPYVMIQDQGFYQRPEISLLTDFLDWLGNPYQSDALLRILRSPFVGGSDFMLRTLASKSFRLDECVDELETFLGKTKVKSHQLVAKRDLLALRRVMNLKRNLRWSREGRKATLLEAILQSSHFREILMTYPEGEQCVANLGLLCDIVDSWEEEEIISYQELVRRLKYYRASSAANQSQAVLSDLENEDAVKVSTIHATKGLEFPIVFVLDVDFDIWRMWDYHHSGKRGVPPELLYAGTGGKFIHLRQLAPPRSTYDLWKKLSEIYGNEPKAGSGFKADFAQIYDDFFSEKWRLYYVALTRARDHLFHGYNYPKGDSLTWGNEFRKRIDAFVEADPKRKKWVTHIEGPPTPITVTTSKRHLIQYASNLSLTSISRNFHPSVIDPTHVYDLLLCPRRYQYGSLMGATGARCNESGHSQFSPLFGGILHEMIERFDYRTNDIQLALSHLDSNAFISQDDKDLLSNAIKEYATFVQSNLSSFGDTTHNVISEKQIRASLDLKGRPTELRGVIDILDVHGNTVRIYDVKSNYLNPLQTDTDKTQLKKEFMRNHHEYQLLTYKELLERQGYQVAGTHVLAISKKMNSGLQWKTIEVKPAIRVIDELEKIMPLSVGDDGLPTNKNKFCRVCEYRRMCGEG